jgi:hypothetical protein
MSERDDPLERLFLGELDPASDEALRYFAEHPGARAELEALRDLEGQLSLAADERREVVEQARNTSGVPGENQVERVLDEHLPVPRAPNRAGPRWLIPLLAAAAVVLLMWGPWRVAEDTAPALDPGPTMGSEWNIQVEGAGSFERFTWERPLEGAQFFQAKVYNPNDLLVELSESGELEQARWTPDPKVAATWPDEIYVEVHVMDGRRSMLLDSATLRRP